MPAFQFIAIDRQGKQVKGIREADSARQIRQQLREQGLTPIAVENVAAEAVKTSKPLSWSLRRSRYRLNVSAIALFTRQLATLVAAGMPLEESLQAVAEQTEKSNSKSLILGVRARVLEGHSLAASMAEFPQAFSDVYRGTIAAGEQTGRLDLVLFRLADYTEQVQQMRQKIQQALIYPTTMSLISFSIVIFLLVYVVPSIVEVFQGTGQSLPTLTKVLLVISSGIQHYGLYLLIGLLLSIWLFRRALKQEKFRFRFHTWLLKLPVFGNTIRTIDTARFSRTFGILIAAGMPALDAMRMSAKLVNRLPIRDALTTATKQVSEGTSIHRALQQTGYFSPMSVHLIASGEASGQLAQMLEHASSQQDDDVRRLIEVSLRLFEPALIIVMGLIVLFIALAVLVPVLSLQQLTG